MRRFTLIVVLGTALAAGASLTASSLQSPGNAPARTGAAAVNHVVVWAAAAPIPTATPTPLPQRKGTRHTQRKPGRAKGDRRSSSARARAQGAPARAERAPAALTATPTLPLPTPKATPRPTVQPTPKPTLPPSPTPTPTTTAPGYWHTKGLWIVDSAGRHVRLAGVTWYGMQNYLNVPAGLDFQNYTVILQEIKQLGFNVIRFPLSDELIDKNPIVRKGLEANPSFVGLHALQVLDRIVAYAGQIGLRIILDNHKSTAGKRKDINTLNEPLWYTKRFSEAKWIHDWVTLAQRYKGNPTVVGFDLRNEPHTNGPGPWSIKTYLHQGATWGPYKGRDNPATDWRLAAERCGNAVLAVNPHLLIFVEGIMQWPDSGQPGGVETYWWGSILKGVKNYPVVLKVAHQLVYSPHEWGPEKYPLPEFNKHTTYKSLVKEFKANWAFILNPHASYAAPIWLGEFGTCNTHVSCVEGTKPGSQGQWFQILMRYLKKHPYVGWSFFAINGTNSNNHTAHNGLLDPLWTHPQVPAMMKALRTIQQP